MTKGTGYWKYETAVWFNKDDKGEPLPVVSEDDGYPHFVIRSPSVISADDAVKQADAEAAKVEGRLAVLVVQRTYVFEFVRRPKPLDPPTTDGWATKDIKHDQ